MQICTLNGTKEIRVYMAYNLPNIKTVCFGVIMLIFLMYHYVPTIHFIIHQNFHCVIQQFLTIHLNRFILHTMLRQTPTGLIRHIRIVLQKQRGPLRCFLIMVYTQLVCLIWILHVLISHFQKIVEV